MKTLRSHVSHAKVRCQRGFSRVGSVLLIVLVVVVLLSLSIYTFTELSLSELEATNMHGRAIEARAYADSGLDVALTVLGTGSDHAGESFFHRPDLFQGILLQDSPVAHGRGRFSVVAPVENDTTYSALRFGLINESSKLNLNAISKLNLTEQQGRTLLAPLPGMTPEVADAILDWLDSDQNIRFQGAESEYYQSLPTPYSATDGPIGSLDELLLVRGVTPELLYGEDKNRNGWIEPDEDNGDGVPQLGWAAFLTIFSQERNLKIDGTPKINVNNNSLMALYDQIEKEFDGETAKFVIGFRMTGDKNSPTNQASQQGANGNAQGQGTGSTNKSSNGSGNNSNRNNQSSDNGNSSSSSSGNDSSSNGGNSDSGSGNGNGSSRGGQGGNSKGQQGGSRNANQSQNGQQQQPTQTRGGIDLSGGAKVTINSIYELVGAQVEVTINGEVTVLESPWSATPGKMDDYLPQLLGTLSTNDDQMVVGRININQARREVLLGIPGMNETIVDKIISAAPLGADGQPLSETFDTRPTNGWLLSDGIVTLEQMRQLDKYVTTGGDVYRLQSVGYFEQGGPVARIEAVIDATRQPPVTMLVRDLSEFGNGYAVDQLLGSAGGR